MRKVSEVCRITGVTRKTLREYEKVGLVLPTNHNERKEGSGNGYRFYDDDAILKIINAKMLMEAGYRRKEIKKIFDDQHTNDIIIYKEAISRLEKQKKHIDGLILYFKQQIASAEYVLRTSAGKDEEYDTSFFGIQAIIPRLLKAIEFNADNMSAEYMKKNELLLPYAIPLVSALCSREEDPTSDIIQNAVNDLYDFLKSDWINMLMETNEYSKEAANSTAEKDMKLLFQEFITDPEVKEETDRTFGEKASAYLYTALKVFIDTRLTNS